MKIYLLAGEASGDLHGAKLIQELKNQYPEAVFKGWGGDLMEKAGMQLDLHYRGIAFIGFTQVLANLRKIFRLFKQCEAAILEFQPDLVILIDYPGFNLRMLPKIKKHGIPIVYYISPQVWAWKAGRVKQIKAHVDLMLCIIPFEQDWYKHHGVEAHYVGNPLLDQLAQYPFAIDFREKNQLTDKPIIALLPGSRLQEIAYILPEILKSALNFPEYQIVLAAAPSREISTYQKIIEGHDVKIVFGQTYDLLKNAHAALVASGTATLETALIGCPQVVVYKGTALSFMIGKLMAKVKYVSMVNLILNRLLVKEFLQSDCNARAISPELDRVLHQESYRAEIIAGYDELKTKIGSTGASKKAADLITNFLKSL
ncbi:MAG: lipid-A-disaccharide synthase [Bacteroidia bacterium]